MGDGGEAVIGWILVNTESGCDWIRIGGVDLDDDNEVISPLATFHMSSLFSSWFLRDW